MRVLLLPVFHMLLENTAHLRIDGVVVTGDTAQTVLNLILRKGVDDCSSEVIGGVSASKPYKIQNEIVHDVFAIEPVGSNSEVRDLVAGRPCIQCQVDLSIRMFLVCQQGRYTGKQLVGELHKAMSHRFPGNVFGFVVEVADEVTETHAFNYSEWRIGFYQPPYK